MANFLEFKMIVTRRLPIEDLEIIEEVMKSLTNLAESDKLDSIGHYLYNDKETSEDVTNDDFHSVRFIGVINNDNYDEI